MSMYLVAGFDEKGALGRTWGETHTSLKSARKGYAEMKAKRGVRVAYLAKVMESHPFGFD